MTEERGSTALRLAGIAWILALAAGAIWLEEPRRVVPASAPPAEFSAERALQQLRQIAKAPHPVGSQEHARVREYLVGQFETLGLEPSVQKTTSVLESYGTAATVENIVGRRRGQTEGPAVLLAAHYDSVPAGPGAGDDGAGVATLLETARALTAGPVLRHDVIFVLTDGEELGLLGAKAFASEHPWKDRAGVVLNFDNRGTSGSVLMYETSPGNSALIHEFARAVPSPRASSLAGTVAQSMPNSSDFYVFLRAKRAGLNFAFIGSPENYHTSQDTPAHVDLRTLQHAGDYALPLVRRLGDADLAALGAPAAARAPDAVFFNVGDWEVVYPQPWARPLGIAGMALFLVVAAIGIRKGAASLGGVAIAVALLLATVLAAWRTADWMALSLARTTRDGIPLGGAGPFLFHPLYALALGCVVAGLTFAAWELAALRWSDLALAGALVWSALSTVLAFRVPAASYLGFWPLLPMLLATGFALAKRDRPRAAVRILIWLGAVPTVWLLAPLLPQLHLALGLNTLGAPALAILATLALWLLAPLVAPDGGGKLWLAVALLAAGGVLFAVAGRTVRYNARHPRPESMAYVLDSDHATAQWMSPVEGQFVGSETPADAWRRQYLSAKPTPASLPIALGPRGMMLMWEHAAPKVELAPPAAELLESTRQDQLRTVRIRVRSQRHAARISIKAEAPMVIPLEVNGHHLGERTQNGKGYALAMSRGLNDRQFWNLLYAAPPDGGVEVTLLVSPDEPLDLLVADISDGLPDIPGQSFAPRPPEITQQHFADATVVVKHFSFGACDTQSALPTGKRAESR